jgi:hypothetical protein
MFRMNGMSRTHGCVGVTMFRMNGPFFAPRQLLQHCSNMLHPCNDAKTSLPPSMAVVCHGRMGAQVL